MAEGKRAWPRRTRPVRVLNNFALLSCAGGALRGHRHDSYHARVGARRDIAAEITGRYFLSWRRAFCLGANLGTARALALWCRAVRQARLIEAGNVILL